MITMTFALSGLLSILFGLIILAWPKTLNYMIAFWLLIQGSLQLITSVL